MQKGSGISGKFILHTQAVGFLTLLAIMWAAEIVRLPHYFFGESAQFIWGRVIGRTVTLLTIWLFVHLTTRRLLQRLHELENFLRVCSWCRRVGQDGRWLTMEEFFDDRFSAETSHGICPECAAKQFGRHRAERVAPPAGS